MAKFHSSQDELYEILRLMWQSCRFYILQFVGLKGFYTSVYIDAREAEIDAAEALPDDQQRGADHEAKRAELLEKKEEGLGFWLQLERYIVSAFTDATVQKARLEEAGKKDFDRAEKNNWEKVKSVMSKGKSFIANHTAELTANNNMPAGFQGTYNTSADGLEPLILAFKGEQEGAKTGTQTKDQANDAIYDTGMDMGDDGKFLFRKDPAKLAEFVFDQVKLLVSSPGKAGFKLETIEDVVFLAIAGAKAAMQQAGKPAITLPTDADGKCFFDSLEVGTYTLTITADGFSTQVLTVEIKTGVISRKKVVMVRAQQPA